MAGIGSSTRANVTSGPCLPSRITKAARAGHKPGELVDELARADDQRADAGADQGTAQDDQPDRVIRLAENIEFDGVTAFVTETE
ncbi:hypothetical protein [Pararhodobacter marinus]|uniref:hypothetical protein n=1 Tax=Pararhodobacter marinus TaxID=2184063 RepID=UPI003515DBFA